jgi:acyl-CoA reductase-like NAD-dependent aldehyde dehydrogenase
MNREQKTVDWRERATALVPRTEAFIDGSYRPALSGATFDCINPATGKTIAAVSSCDAVDVEAAVASARRVFDAGHWSRRAPAARKKVLLRFAELIRKHREELALTETLDMGKPITDSLKIDIPAAANCIAWYAEAIDKVYDQIAPTSRRRSRVPVVPSMPATGPGARPRPARRCCCVSPS